MGSSRISQKEVDWQRSIILSGIQSSWDRTRIWMHLFTERYCMYMESTFVISKIIFDGAYLLKTNTTCK